MKKIGIFSLLAFLISCGPEEKSPWSFYELVYSTTVQTHKSQSILQKQLDDVLSDQQNDTIIQHPELIKTLNDSNLVLLTRIEYAINVLKNTPEDAEYADQKQAAIMMLRAQQLYQGNSFLAVISACEDGVISQKDQITLLVMRESFTALSAQYAKWQEVRDNFLEGLQLPEAEQLRLEAQYGSD